MPKAFQVWYIMSLYFNFIDAWKYFSWIHQLETDHKNLQLINNRLMTIFSHLFANFKKIFCKTEAQRVILRCLTGLNINWFKSYDTKHKKQKNKNWRNWRNWQKWWIYEKIFTSFFKHFHEYPNEKLRYIDIRLFNFIAFGMINLQYAKKCICIIESQWQKMFTPKLSWTWIDDETLHKQTIN